MRARYLILAVTWVSLSSGFCFSANAEKQKQYRIIDCVTALLGTKSPALGVIEKPVHLQFMRTADALLPVDDFGPRKEASTQIDLDSLRAAFSPLSERVDWSRYMGQTVHLEILMPWSIATNHLIERGVLTLYDQTFKVDRLRNQSIYFQKTVAALREQALDSNNKFRETGAVLFEMDYEGFRSEVFHSNSFDSIDPQAIHQGLSTGALHSLAPKGIRAILRKKAKRLFVKSRPKITFIHLHPSPGLVLSRGDFAFFKGFKEAIARAFSETLGSELDFTQIAIAAIPIEAQKAPDELTVFSHSESLKK